VLAAVKLWLLLSAWLVGAGWILSVLHQLNWIGYGLLLVVTAAIFSGCRQRPPWRPRIEPAQLLNQFRRRFTRPAPLIFLILAAAAFAGGALYPTVNGDSNSYRIPRVLHWLGAGHWHWIHTGDLRMNIAGCNFEWLCAPIILLMRTGHGMFLANWVSYLLLPGLIFSVFTRLGVQPRVAWWWMWLLASGWCYAFQAATDINDSFAVIYALAAVDFALRARASGRVSEWWFSLLGAALLTGTKQTCLPLAALWGIAVWPGLGPMWRRPWRTLAVVLAALLVSGLPLMLFNWSHTGNWMGLPSPGAGVQGWGWSNTSPASPFWGVVGNMFCLTAQNLKPPFFPMADAWNNAMQQFVATPIGSHFASFESFATLDNSTRESNAGIGLGICLITLVSLAWALKFRKPQSNAAAGGDAWTTRALRLAPWGLLVLFMAKVGTYQNARQLAPYYVFLFPSLLILSGHARVVRQVAWQWLAYAVMLGTLILLFLSRGHPLFPAQTLFGNLAKRYPDSTSLAHLAVSYSTQSIVQTQLNCLQDDLPPGEKIIGYYSTYNCVAEPGLWQPLGVRRILRVLPGDSPEQVRREALHYIVVDEQALLHSEQSIQEWLHAYDAEVVREKAFLIQWGKPLRHYYLVRLN